jgi:hypothetical protein
VLAYALAAGTSARAWSFLNLPEDRYFRRPLGGVKASTLHWKLCRNLRRPVAGDREEWDDHQLKKAINVLLSVENYRAPLGDPSVLTADAGARCEAPRPVAYIPNTARHMLVHEKYVAGSDDGAYDHCRTLGAGCVDCRPGQCYKGAMD